MKLKLLLTAFALLYMLSGFAQAEAYPVPDIHQCNNEVFDLTVNSPIVLGNQDPDDYSVTFFLSSADAQANINPLANPTAYIPEFGFHIIFVRVENNTTGEYDIEDFYVSWTSSVMDFFEDVNACGSYTLYQTEPMWLYYTGPDATGTQMHAGDVITTTTTVYVYSTEACNAQDSFVVTITDPLEFEPSTPLYGCDYNGDDVIIYDLTSKIEEILNGMAGYTVTFHETQEDAAFGFNAIPNPSAYANILSLPQMIYVRVASQNFDCYSVLQLPLLEGGCTDNDVTGLVQYDMDNNGCDVNDAGFANIPVMYTSGNFNVITFTSANGEYSFTSVPDGTGTITVMPSILYTTPASQQVTFPVDPENPVNFCLTAPEPVNDVAVQLVPYSIAQPGFDVYYMLVIENWGNQVANGTVTVQFDASKMTFFAATPLMTLTGNTLTLNYSNLQPLHAKTVFLEFTMLLPGVVNQGDVLTFTSSVTPLAGDANPLNNSHVLNHVVTNSFDPNNIAVREGDFITPEQADEYLHYTIRFQNMGNANAQFVKILTELDSNLDVSTFQPLASSHDFVAKVEGTDVEFFFDDIQLAGAEADEPGSHGFVSYRIKPKTSVSLGDVMAAQAGIYFDFNPVVQTNIVTTTIQNTMGLNNFAADGFMMYPNPTSGKVALQLVNTSSDAITVVIADVLGKTVISRELTLTGSAADMDVSALTRGIYFVTLTADGKSVTKKLMVK